MSIQRTVNYKDTKFLVGSTCCKKCTKPENKKKGMQPPHLTDKLQYINFRWGLDIL